MEQQQIVTVFRNRLRDEARAEYTSVAAVMWDLATHMPGFVDSKTFESADGERVTIVTFAGQASHNAWRDHPEHRVAQQAGIDRFYATYSIQVGQVTYARQFVRP
jgi:heme-degrading monooxygenase HmoA